MSYQQKQKVAESRVLIKFIKGEWGIYDVPLGIKLHCLPEDIDAYRLWDYEKALNKVIDTYTRADLVNFMEMMEISLPSSSSNSKPKKKAIAVAIVEKCIFPQSFSPNTPSDQQVPWSSLLENKQSEMMNAFIEEKFGAGAWQKMGKKIHDVVRVLLEETGISTPSDAVRMLQMVWTYEMKQHTKSDNKSMMRKAEKLLKEYDAMLSANGSL